LAGGGDDVSHVNERVTGAESSRDHVLALAHLSARAVPRFGTDRGSLLVRAPLGLLLFPFLPLAAVVLLWAVALERVDVREITDLGLVSVLPSSHLLAVLILSLSFCITLRLRPTSNGLPFLHVLVLVLLLYATPIILEEIPRVHVTWRHVGIVDSIVRNGTVDPNLDVYSNWPGFFLLFAFLSGAAGITDLLALAEWAPLYLNLLYLGPLFLLFRSITFDQRVCWLAIWFFYCTNWVGQDYFSPQGFSFFLYLSIFALIAAYFEPRATMIRKGRSDIATFARPDRVGLILLVTILIAASVPTHQLTPIQIVISLAFVVALRRGQLASLLGLSAVLVAAWLVYVASPFLDGHLAEAVDDIGSLGSTLDANVGERIRGSADHLLVLRTRLALTAAVWGLAVLGFLRVWRANGRPCYGLFAVLAVSPFALLGLQSYGGEVLLRVFLFSLPFMAFFAASLIYPTGQSGRTWRATTVAFAISVGLVASFGLARYGNERADTFTPDEVAAVEHLYRVAAPESVLIAGDENLPWKAQAYEQHSYVVLPDIAGWDDEITRGDDRLLAARVADFMGKAPARSYLIITRSQKAAVDVLGKGPPGSLARLEDALTQSRDFKVIYANQDARIFTLRSFERLPT
jgi:hypothetical protein